MKGGLMSSWFKRPINIGITVGAAILLVAAIVLIIWGVTHHEEGGILEVCWVDGEARYVEGSERDHGACEGAQELVWPQEQIPLTIAALSAEGQPLGEDAPEALALNQAVSDFNSQVGFELFRVGTGLQSTDAEAHFGGAIQSGSSGPAPGYVTHRRMGGTGLLRGYLHVRSDVVADVRLLHVVLLHELGHLAGLKHDDFTLSIMFPITRQMDAMSTAHITDVDRSNLQGLYRVQ
jgi:hypothetical protein